ncbi:hypothetical protein MPSEU_000027000 [Mayamaea pseudoterrestris]|nr:hypothetical protein MPSEU_000027000 [Mayamaea pseudoterrestris]
MNRVFYLCFVLILAVAFLAATAVFNYPLIRPLLDNLSTDTLHSTAAVAEETNNNLHFCQSSFSNTSKEVKGYKCAGPAYDNFTNRLWEYAHAKNDSTWGRRQYPLPPNVSVFVLGNSHTRQTYSAMRCQYYSQLASSKDHLDLFGGSKNAPSTWRYKNNATMVVLSNSPFVYHKEQWAQTIERMLGRSLSSFDAVVMGRINTIETQSNFGRSLANFSKDHPELFDSSFTTPTVERLSQVYTGPIVAVPMFAAYGQDVKENARRTAENLKRTENRTNIRIVDARKHIMALGEECGSDESTGVGECLNVAVKGGRNPADMHRCTGRKGGHPDLVAWDVIEKLHRKLWVSLSMLLLLAVTWLSVTWTVFRSSRRQSVISQERMNNLREVNGPTLIHGMDTSNDFQELRGQLMIPGNRTYTEECRSKYLYNSTWGKLHAPWADKVQTKTLLRALNISGIRIPRTLALFNATTLRQLEDADLQEHAKHLPSNYIIKPAHTSGAVARVVNGSRYSCFKKCRHPATNAQLPAAYAIMLKNMRYSVHHMHSNKQYEAKTKGRQTQYEYIPKRIILEKHLPLDSLQEWHWWMVNGQVLFVCLRCGEYGSYYSTRFQPLQMAQGLLPCLNPPKQPPKSWSNMLQSVAELGRHIPGVIRLDVYASDFDETVYFSEVTFTSTSCGVEMEPVVADALLYAFLHENVTNPTPEFVESVINDRSCVELAASVGQWWSADRNVADWRQARQRAHASPTDLCRDLATSDAAKCIAQTRHVAKHPLQCIATDRNASAPVKQAIGQYREPHWRNVMARVDWPWATGLFIVLLLLKYLSVGNKECNQLWSVFGYLCLVAVYKWQSTHNDGLFSPDSMWTTIVHSYKVFVLVHPMHSHFIALTHVATYWFEIAAWRARTLQSMLFWFLLYELIASFVNEYSHFQETDDGVRCMRVLFIGTMKQYAVDDIFRAYLCAPLFVYGILLPGLLYAHIGGSSLLVLAIGGGLCLKRAVTMKDPNRLLLHRP